MTGMRIMRFALLLTLTVGSAAVAQDTPLGDGEPLRRDTVRLEWESVQNDPNLDAQVKADAEALYQEAIKAIDARETWAKRAEDFQNLQESAPARTDEVRSRMPPPNAEVTIDAPEEPALRELRVGEAKARIDRDVAQARVALLNNEEKRRRDRRQEITQLLLDARSSLEGPSIQDDVPSSAPAHPAVNEARSVAERARIEASQEQIRAFEHEILSYELRTDLLAARKEEASRQLAIQERKLQLWQQKMQEFRRRESQQDAVKAQDALEQASAVAPRIREYAETSATENSALVERRMGADGLLSRNTRATQRLTAVRANLEATRSDFEDLKKRVDAAGSSGTLAPLFQNFRDTLPEPAALEKNIRQRERAVTEAQVDLLELEERRRSVEDTSQSVDDLLLQVQGTVSESERESLRKILTEQIDSKRATLESLIGDYTTYIQSLTELNAAERDLKAVAEEFLAYIRERALWMRSTKPIALADGATILTGVRDAFADNSLIAVLRSGFDDSVQGWYLYAVFFLPLLVWVVSRRPLLAYYGAALTEGSKRFTATIRPTLGALVVAILRKSAVPILFGGVGWRMSLDVDQTELFRAVGQGIMAVSTYGFGLRMIIELCRPEGLCEAHLAWNKAACVKVRQRLRWYFPSTAPAVFLVAFCASHGATPWTQALGRVAIIVWCSGSVLLTGALLRPQQGGISLLFGMSERPSSRRFMGVIYALVAVFLLFTIALTCLGFQDTAVRLALNTYFSSLLAATVYLSYSVGARWFLMERRQMALEKRRERAKDVAAEAVAEEKEELVRIDEQTRALWRSGCWLVFLLALGWIWAEQIPALQGLKNVELWTITETVNETVINPETNTEEIVAKDLPKPISLLELATALAIVGVGAMVIRNTPGFMETAFLRHLSLGSGERYALNTLLQYIFMMVVTVWAFSSIGIGWAKVQWLAAALSVGLGFGLQEIFANFVSGLIVLFERPVRVGDLITINGQSGTVSKIKIRATTIRDFEKKELIVPNKDLVTGQLLNWTLTDSTIRVAAPFGVAYGTDIEKMEETLWGVLQSDERILKDPGPIVIFAGFGDNSLNYDVFVFVALSDMLPVQNLLRKGIDAAFRKADIEMSFPQRDLHFRGPLEIISAGGAKPVESVPEDKETA